MREMVRLFSVGLAIFASTCFAGSVSVTLVDPPESGMVIFKLFDSANAFGELRDPAVQRSFPLDGSASYQLDDLPAGEYALLIYYDENGNEVMDRNFIGIPREPLGFSNEYQPKGPPSYPRAAFQLAEDEAKQFEVALRRPLGERGRIGVGVGVIGRSSPYRDYDSGVYQFIPAVTYNGNRFRIFGPNAQVGLVGSDDLRLALTGQYRIGVYEEDESDFLEGMDDRDSTFMAGLALQAELPWRVKISASYEHDVLDHIGGGTASLSVRRSHQLGLARLAPSLGVNWLGADLSQHDFGVAANEAREGRPAYDLDETLSYEAGLSCLLDLGEDWLFIVTGAAEWLDDEVTDSPIVDEDMVFKGFAALNYLF